jgi:hypothetical protein
MHPGSPPPAPHAPTHRLSWGSASISPADAAALSSAPAASVIRQPRRLPGRSSSPPSSPIAGRACGGRGGGAARRPGACAARHRGRLARRRLGPAARYGASRGALRLLRAPLSPLRVTPAKGNPGPARCRARTGFGRRRTRRRYMRNDRNGPAPETRRLFARPPDLAPSRGRPRPACRWAAHVRYGIGHHPAEWRPAARRRGQPGPPSGGARAQAGAARARSGARGRGAAARAGRPQWTATRQPRARQRRGRCSRCRSCRRRRGCRRCGRPPAARARARRRGCATPCSRQPRGTRRRRLTRPSRGSRARIRRASSACGT